MINSTTIATHSHDDYVVLPMDDGSNARCPHICITLMGAGDMWGEASAEPARKRLLSSLAVEEHRLRLLAQIHSTRVIVADELPACDVAQVAPLTEGDGLVAAESELVLGVRVADCYPIFLMDAESGAFGVAHSGWRGTGIAIESLEAMRRAYGTRASNVKAVVGPGIGSCCYDVPVERANLFRSRFGGSSVRERNGRFYLDLMEANLRLLEGAGVRDITAIVDCTSCNPFLGSFRREGPEQFTHMLALIGYFG